MFKDIVRERASLMFIPNAFFLISLIIAVAALLVTPCTRAGQWYDAPAVTLRLGYDDNVRFSEQDKESSFSQTLTATTGFGYRTELSDVILKATADINRYSEEPDLDADNQYLNLNAGYRIGLNLFRLESRFARDTSHTSELETTGLIQRSKRRYSANINPTWTRTLNETTSLRFGYRYNDVTYQDSSTTGLLDYKFHDVSAMLVKTFDTRTQFSVSTTATHYKVPSSNSEADNLSIQLGVRRLLSETTTADIAVGGRLTESKVEDSNGKTESDTNSGFLINASLEKRFTATTRLRGSLSRELVPTGSGRLLDSKRIGIDFSHDLSERLSFSTVSSLFRNETNNNSFRLDNDEERTFFSIEPKLRWRVTRWWDLTGSYRYRYQKYDGRSISTDSNAFFIYATYNWPREPVDKSSEL